MIRGHKVERTVVPFRVVAAEVFPDSTVRNAMHRLRRFIATDPELLSRLESVGYRTTRHWLSPSMRMILDEYL